VAGGGVHRRQTDGDHGPSNGNSAGTLQEEASTHASLPDQAESDELTYGRVEIRICSGRPRAQVDPTPDVGGQTSQRVRTLSRLVYDDELSAKVLLVQTCDLARKRTPATHGQSFSVELLVVDSR
jgi:hypothetical protein